jgi:nucleotide-binding universal stress UspA family protein
VVAPLTLVPPYDGDEEAVRLAAEEALREAGEQVSASAAHTVRGPAGTVLLDRIERHRASLVAVGSHGLGRLTGAFAGSTATELVHRAPCSVLIARGDESWTPERIVVGLDGSAGSAAAFAAASRVAERPGSSLTVVVAEAGRAADVAAVSLLAGDGAHVVEGDPVDVLAAASEEADLLVVGSRGLHGVRALGSVSERVAHRAACSTLVVREA